MKQTTTITSSVSKGTEKEDPTKMKNGIKTPIPAVGAKIVGDPAKKQGAYGKIKIHKESKLSQLSRFDEIWCTFNLLYVSPLKSNMETPEILENFNQENLDFCDEILGKVSRSFAAVIRQLPPSLLVDIMIFYLVLRALDTIEDDMTAFDSTETKVKLLLKFHETALVDPEWRMDGVGEGDERRLLQHFPKCHSVFSSLRPESREIIADITFRMATGMAEFVNKDLGQGTTDVKQYNRYCHFVAGLVGEGLTRLFVASGLEDPEIVDKLFLSDQMGLFLQKNNIIRDYLEDYVDGRAFWPQSIWKKYSKNGDLGYFANQSEEENRKQSLKCLNELVTDALELAPDCLAYLSKLRCDGVFRFCAIPQVMAIATLDKCYNNLDVFTGVVKIRKGLSCKLLLQTNDVNGVHNTFYVFAKSIAQRAQQAKEDGVDDPSYERTMNICNKICELTDNARKTSKNRDILYHYIIPTVVIALVACLSSLGYSDLIASFDASQFDLQSVLTLLLASFAFGHFLEKLSPGPSGSLKTASDILAKYTKPHSP